MLGFTITIKVMSAVLKKLLLEQMRGTLSL